jgi:hypothetical protein
VGILGPLDYQTREMTSFEIGLLVFACVFGGAVSGMLIGVALPEHHLSPETRSVVSVASGTISVLTALVIGLLIASTKGAFDTQTKEVQGFSADLSLLDRVMLKYGPETSEARDLLRRYAALKITLIWPEENTGGPRIDDPTALEMLEGVQEKLLQLTPQNDAQRWLQSRALQIGGNLIQARWLMSAQNESSIPLPFLVTLVFWLTILFTSFGLFAPRNATAAAALLVCALSVSAAIFLILEMDRPFDGLIKVSAEPARNALAHMRP